MKKIVIIGANGQLGTDMQKSFAEDSSYEVIPLTRDDIDITSIESASKTLTDIKPDMIVNTAAYHKVDEIEDNLDQAFFVNVIAQKNIAELSAKNSWELVFFSTDYVFGLDEKRTAPYIETDAPGPVNAYGISKLAGEYAVRYAAPKHFVIRVCGLFGSVGSMGKGGNFVETMIKLGREKGQVSVVNDQVLTPSYTMDIAHNLKDLFHTDSYGLYHMTAEGQCSWYEFACEIFRLMNMDVKCIPVDSQTFKTRAKRPRYSVLKNKHLEEINLNKMKDWKEGLKLYLQEKKYID